MSLSTTSNRAQFTGNGVTTTFATGFQFDKITDLVVLIIDMAVPAAPTVSTKVLNTDYTATGGIGSSGSVVMTVAPSATKLVVIYRDVVLTQDLNLVENEKIPVEEVELRLDRGMMAHQRTREISSKGVRIPEGFTATFDPTLPIGTPSANSVPTLNASGTGWAPYASWPLTTQLSASEANAAIATAQAALSAASAAASATSATNATTNGAAQVSLAQAQVTLASLWAAQFNGAVVNFTDFSAKEWAIGAPTGTSAKGWAQQAAASAAAAAATASLAIWRDVVFKTFADSPISVVAADAGKLFSIDATGGNVVINLPTIAGLPTTVDFVMAVKKTDASANTITLNRASTDTIDGGTSKVISSTNAGTTLIADTDPTPDVWTSADFGAVTGNLVVDSFTGTGAQTVYSLSVSPASKNNTWVYISGVMQQKSTYTLAGSTLTFSAAPPTGTLNIEVVSGATLLIGTPADGTVTNAKMAPAPALTIKGNVTGGSAAPTDLTATQLNTLLFVAPTIQKFLSGGGTYTTPANVKYIRVRMAGGGGGGSGGGSAAGAAAGDGGTTTFGSSLLSAGGGIKGIYSAAGGAGGSGSLGTGPIGIAFAGTPGGGGGSNAAASASYAVGGNGGSNAFGGGGGTGLSNNPGGAACPNTGGGGGGGGGGATANNQAGSGGGSGAYIDAIVAAPLGTYSYAVGAGGTAGGAGTSGGVGAAGAAGIIIVEEYYS